MGKRICVKIRDEAKALLDDLCEATGAPQHEVIDAAICEWDRNMREEARHAPRSHPVPKKRKRLMKRIEKGTTWVGRTSKCKGRRITLVDVGRDRVRPMGSARWMTKETLVKFYDPEAA